MLDKPLTVQSDRTMLLDVHSPSYDECRRDIITFSSLIKSPEHIHTYEITPLSVWNAIVLGFDTDDIVSKLKKWSKYEIDERILHFIDDTAKRYGLLILEEYDDTSYILYVRSSPLYYRIKNDRTLNKYLRPDDNEEAFLIDILSRGTIKASLIRMGYPVIDSIPLKKGAPTSINLNDDVILRDYQKRSRDTFLESGGYGVVVLPCGSGKTVVGLSVMASLKTKTLILTPNVTAVHQWRREILNKTDVPEERIGEYSGERKEIRDITICTYQILTQSRTNEKDEKEWPHYDLFNKNDWGLVIYDEVHMLPAPVFSITGELQSKYRLGLTATLIREDGKEDYVFTLLGPKRIDIPWVELEDSGYIAKALCTLVKVGLTKDDEIIYALGDRNVKYRTAALNKNKIEALKKLLKRHEGESTLIIGEYISQLEEIRKETGYPLITGSMSNAKRDELYDLFREGRIKVLIVSRVANYALDLPDASVAIQVSGSYGSRQEEAQRLGRILRPKKRDSHFYTLISEYTLEEDMSEKRQKFLSEQGYSYTMERI